MNEYDEALKSLLRGSANVLLRQITGTSIRNWLNIEIPQREGLRVDLVGLTADENLLHMELQSRPDTGMAFRMLEYDVGLFKVYGRFARQVVLYVGQTPPRMQVRLDGPGLAYRYDLVDIRDLDGMTLLESGDLSDNILAILARLRDPKYAVDEIVDRISRLQESRRLTPLRQLLTLSGLRGLGRLVEREVERVPILENILDHEVLGREFKRGLQEGRQEGELKVLRLQIEKRFGAIPPWADQRLLACSSVELENIGVRLLDANTLEDLLK